nr:PREDICTED: monocyte to macrophage differentiation factor isoform X1 [Bemisia tabaci]
MWPNAASIQPLTSRLKRIRWMNSVSNSKVRYDPTPIEHIMNILTHGLVIVPSIYGGIVLVQQSQNFRQIFAAVIYGISLVFIFTMSTLFHLTAYFNYDKKVKDFFHRGDRAMIYIFIAASYFPWLILSPAIRTNEITLHFWWIVWLFAVVGVIYQQIFHEKYKRLETLLYVLSGLLPAIPIVRAVRIAGLEELKLGGVLYLFGVFFFKSDGKIPCAHAIWHTFVAFAAAVHFFAVYHYLYLVAET